MQSVSLGVIRSVGNIVGFGKLQVDIDKVTAVKD